MAKPITTTDARFRFDVLNAEGAVLVDFYADWCRPCQLLGPILDELAADWEDRVKIVKVNVERNPGLTKTYEIQSLPTLVLFEGGAEQVRLVNVIRRAAIEKHLAAVGLAA
jgi:thioredoxin 1